jgi:mannose-6-phosphate isomerase-like protein (cupin superfamily)
MTPAGAIDYNNRMTHIFKPTDATILHKHGIDLTVFPPTVPTANVVRVDVKEGHFQEFYDKVSTYIYYIIKGTGTFVLNDTKEKAQAGDLVVVPPKTHIYYFGTMSMVLTVTPAFNPANEVHVRFIEKSESTQA